MFDSSQIDPTGYPRTDGPLRPCRKIQGIKEAHQCRSTNVVLPLSTQPLSARRIACRFKVHSSSTMVKLSRKSGLGLGFRSHMRSKTRYVNVCAYIHPYRRIDFPAGGAVQVVWAVETGYRHIDCAYVYGNQDEVHLLHVPLFIAPLMK